MRPTMKLCRQCSALGLLLFLGRRWQCLQRLKLCFNRRDIGIDQVIEQAGLLGIHLLAALGKLQSLELRDLVSQFLDHRLVAVDLLAHGVDLRQQLRCQGTQLLSQDIWWRLDEEVMLRILPEQAVRGDRPIG